jgi:chromosome segregation ATPase
MPGWQQTAHQISDHVSDFDSRVSRCAAELLTSQARYVATAGLVQDLIKGGWTPDDLAAKLDKVRGDLATANDHKQAGRDVIAVILLELANAEIDQLVPALQQIKDRREAIAAKLQKLQPITAQAMASIEQATGIITRLSSTYAPSAWEQLKGNGAKSTALLADAQKQLEAATASLTSGDLDTADSQLVQAEKQLAEVKSQMRSVQTLASSLDDTAADLPRLLKAAQQALEQARKAEHDFDTDAGDAHKAELVSVAEMLAEAEQLCHVERHRTALPPRGIKLVSFFIRKSLCAVGLSSLSQGER